MQGACGRGCAGNAAWERVGWRALEFEGLAWATAAAAGQLWWTAPHFVAGLKGLGLPQLVAMAAVAPLQLLLLVFLQGRPALQH
eukprot:scaffold208267_cov18-Tisochrysis_lutea.AAC.1